MQKDQSQTSTSVAIWLIMMAVLIAVMVTVGGATRLTDSGLSIVEWDLVKGALPPLSDAAWEEALAEYRQIPEYQLVNKGMSMAEFQEIFWWEWGHRQLGRFIGLAYALPLIWFSWRGAVTGSLRWRLWGLFGGICLQGAIGWYMVSSGLSERIDVSQYRLALHLGTAFILFGLIVWQAVALMRPQGMDHAGRGLARLSYALIAGTAVQVLLGAFVAGLRAGRAYNTWPLMGDEFFPDAYGVTANGGPAIFESIAAVQFNHRMGAYALFALAVWFAVKSWRAGAAQRRCGMAILAGMTGQAILGIWTLLAGVPLWLGLAHQLGALAVLTLTIWVAFNLSPRSTRPAAL